MRIRIVVMIVLALALTLGAGAQPPAAPADLAAFVPPDVLFYVEFSVSDATVSGIDSLIANLTGRIGVEPPPTFDGLVQILGLRQWLGSKGAIAALPNASPRDARANVIGLLQIRDRAAVEAYLVDQANATRVPLLTGSAASVFNLSYGLSVSVTDNLIIATTGLAGATVPGPNGPSLATHAPYRDALAALPGGDYAATAYLDPRGLVFTLAGAAPHLVASSAVNLPALSDSLGVWSAGLSQLDDRSYALDVAHIYGARHLFESLYVAPPPVAESAPIDPGWLSILPDDVWFAGQFSRPWTQIRTFLDAVAIGGNALRTRALVNAALFEDVTGLDPIRSPLALIPPSLSSTVAINTLEGLLGMTDAELTAAFDGQAAVALRVRESPGAPAFDVLFAVESPSLDASHHVLRAVRTVTPLIDAFPVEAGDDVLIYEAPGGAFESRIELLADVDAVYFGSESLILADKQTLVAVPRLTDSAPFVHDRAFFLPDATHLAYIHLPPLRDLFGMRTAAGDLMLEDSPEFRNFLDTFDSLWISSRTEPSRAVTRLAFTLTE